MLFEQWNKVCCKDNREWCKGKFIVRWRWSAINDNDVELETIEHPSLPADHGQVILFKRIPVSGNSTILLGRDLTLAVVLKYSYISLENKHKQQPQKCEIVGGAVIFCGRHYIRTSTFLEFMFTTFMSYCKSWCNNDNLKMQGIKNDITVYNETTLCRAYFASPLARRINIQLPLYKRQRSVLYGIVCFVAPYISFIYLFHSLIYMLYGSLAVSTNHTSKKAVFITFLCYFLHVYHNWFCS